MHQSLAEGLVEEIVLRLKSLVKEIFNIRIDERQVP